MSRTTTFAALQEIRNWNLDDVLIVLNKNGLGECAEAFKKRDIDGSSLLDLTEVKLALWKNHLNLNTIRKLSRFVQDLNQIPEKYVLHGNAGRELPVNASSTTTSTTTATVKEVQQHSSSMKGLLPTRSVSSSSYSDNESWGTDFDDDFDEGPPEKVGSSSKKENLAPVAPSTTPRGWGESDGKKKRSAKSPVSVEKDIKTPVPKASGIKKPPRIINKKPPDQEGKNHPKLAAFRPPTKVNIPDAFSSKLEAVTSNTKSFLYKGVTNFQSPMAINNQNSFGSKPNVAPPASDVSKPSQAKREAVTNAEPPTRAPVPFRPPILTPKPLPPTANKKWNLPKPPAHMQGNVENVRDIISNLNIPAIENKTISDLTEDYYESLDGDTFPELENMRLKITSTTSQTAPSAESNAVQAPIYPVKHPERSFPLNPSQDSSESRLQRGHSPISPIKHSSSPVPQVERNERHHSPSPLPLAPSPIYRNSSSPQQNVYEEEVYEVCDESVSSFNENGYESEEYECIEDHQALPPVLGDSSEYYLQPVAHQPQSQPNVQAAPSKTVPTQLQVPTVAPPLPAKPKLVLPDVIVPIVRSPSSPRTIVDESSSAGNSSDGATGKLGGLIWKVLNRPGNSSNTASEIKERTTTPETKKNAIPPLPGHKPPLVDQRPLASSKAQGRPLPLPPTRGGAQEKSTSSSLHRTNPRAAIANMPWFHDVDRQKGVELLKDGENGCFLVRPSTLSHNPLTLTLWYNKRLYNISIRQRTDGRYALGTEKANEQSFVSVEELIVNYQSEELVLHSAGERTGRTMLTTSPRREP